MVSYQQMGHTEAWKAYQGVYHREEEFTKEVNSLVRSKLQGGVYQGGKLLGKE